MKPVRKQMKLTEKGPHHEPECCPENVTAGPLPDGLDLRRDGPRRAIRLSLSGGHPSLQRRADGRRAHQPADRLRPDPDDVPAAGEGEIRDAAEGLFRREDRRLIAAAELGSRPNPDVCARGGVLWLHRPGVVRPGRSLGPVHDWPDHGGHRPLHRHGAGLEPAGEG